MSLQCNCHNIQGSYTCSCNTGYTGSAFFARVSSAITAMAFSYPHFPNIQILMSASPPMEFATKTAITQMEVTHAHAIMATNLAVMDILVKVGYVEKKISTVS